MELRDRTTAEAVAQISTLLAQAYQRHRSVRRIELPRLGGGGTVNRELDNARPESPHCHEVEA
jgi:hypothetical protein